MGQPAEHAPCPPRTAELIRQQVSPGEMRLRRVAEVQPFGLNSSLEVSELMLPAGAPSVLTDEDIANYEAAVLGSTGSATGTQLTASGLLCSSTISRYLPAASISESCVPTSTIRPDCSTTIRSACVMVLSR